MVRKNEIKEGHLYCDTHSKIYLICREIDLHPYSNLADTWTMDYIRPGDAGINKYYWRKGMCYLESALYRLRRAGLEELTGELL